MRRPRGTGLALILAGLTGCGPEQPPAPPLPMGKVAPTLPRMVRQRTLVEWLEEARAPQAPRRAAALMALPELMSEAGALASVVQPALSDPEADVRHAALLAVARFPGDLGPEVAEHAVRLLEAAEPAVARAARQAVAGLAEPACGRALRRVWFAVPGQRPPLRVLRALPELGVGAAAVAEGLALLVEPADDGQAAVLRALEQLGATALPALAARLPEVSDDVAAQLLGVMARSGAAQAAHLPVLASALKRGPAARRAAQEALFEAGETALALLDRLAQEGDPEVAQAARQVAARIRETASPR